MVARSEAPGTEVVQRRAEAERHGPRAAHRRVAEGHGHDQGAQQQRRRAHQAQRPAAERHAVGPAELGLGPAEAQQGHELHGEGAGVERHVELDELREGQREQAEDARAREHERIAGRPLGAHLLAQGRGEEALARHRLHAPRGGAHEGVEQPRARAHRREAHPRAERHAAHALGRERKGAELPRRPLLRPRDGLGAARQEGEQGRGEHHAQGQPQRLWDGALALGHLARDERDGVKAGGGPHGEGEQEQEVRPRAAREQAAGRQQHDCEWGKGEDREHDGGARGEGDAAHIEPAHAEDERGARGEARAPAHRGLPEVALQREDEVVAEDGRVGGGVDGLVEDGAQAGDRAEPLAQPAIDPVDVAAARR
eukprot:scaffold4421_cov63-Phaeocystis_antarctica.AAC.2